MNIYKYIKLYLKVTEAKKGKFFFIKKYNSWTLELN